VVTPIVDATDSAIGSAGKKKKTSRLGLPQGLISFSGIEGVSVPSPLAGYTIPPLDMTIKVQFPEISGSFGKSEKSLWTVKVE